MSFFKISVMSNLCTFSHSKKECLNNVKRLNYLRFCLVEWNICEGNLIFDNGIVINVITNKN